jgi:hypothetical protein
MDQRECYILRLAAAFTRCDMPFWRSATDEDRAEASDILMSQVFRGELPAPAKPVAPHTPKRIRPKADIAALLAATKVPD